MQPVAFAARPSFSWKKGLLHGLAAVAVFLFVGMVFASVGAFGDQSGKIGEAAGRQMVIAFLLAVAASYGFQSGKTLLGLAMTVLVALLLAFQIFLFARIARQHAGASPMTAAEKEHPARETGRPRLCQSALGFSFPDPGGDFAPAPDLEARLQKPGFPANASQWVWTSSGTGERILVQAIKGVGRTEGDFNDFTAGVKNGLTSSGKVSLADERLHWTDGHGEYTVSGSFTNGVHLQMRCLSRGPEGGHPPLAVCLQTFTAGGEALREVEAGLEVAACGGG
jgi:hypothetical protein